MVEILARLCFLCYDDGLERVAVATYEAQDGELYDICKKHKKQVEGYDIETFKWKAYIRER